MRHVAYLIFFGAAGTLSRYGVYVVSHRVFGERFPFATLIVNLSGCLVAGLLMGLMASRTWISDQMQLALAVGFLGAFTTFSTFSLDTFRYVKDGIWGLALLNVFLNVTLGIALTAFGFFMARS